MPTTHAPRRRAPIPLLAVAAAGLAWNAFGLWRLAATAFATEADLVAGGFTPAQAALYAALPGWMDLAFAVGVLGGMLGCVLLMLGRRLARPVLGVSLAAYLALYAGDIAHGVFAAFGAGQVAVLTVVVLVAAGLLWLAARPARGDAPA